MDVRHAERCVLIAQHGLPVVVAQALRDLTLPQGARLMMFYLTDYLDFVEYREVKVASLASAMKTHHRSTGRLLALLVSRGYLRCRPRVRNSPRAYVMPWSRVANERRAA